MTSEEYNQARVELGFKNRKSLSDWFDLIKISADTHRSYSSGRLKVNPRVQKIISLLEELKQEKEKNHILLETIVKLQEKISEIQTEAKVNQSKGNDV